VRKSIRLKPSIGVHEQQQLAGGGFGTLVAGPRLATPAVGQRLRGHNRRAQLARQLGGAVGGAVVYDEDLAWLQSLRDEGAKQGGEVVFFVACGDDEADARRRSLCVGPRASAKATQ